MPITQPTFKPSEISVNGSTNAIITNLSMPSANTEYSHALQANVKQLWLRARGNSVLKLAFTSGESGTKFFTVSRGAVLFLDQLSFTGVTLYLQASLAADTIEIMELL